MIRAVLSAMALVALAGCGDGTRIYCSTPRIDPEQFLAPYAVVGERFTASWRIATGGCPEDPGPGITGVAVETADPAGAGFDAEVTGPESTEQPYTFRVTFAFTPQRQGTHHVLLDLKPSWGIVQFSLHALADAREVPPIEIHAPGSNCDDAALTTRNGMLCRDRQQGSLHFWRNAVELTAWPRTARMQVLGDTIWVLESAGTLRRLRDEGGGPPVASAAPLSGVPAGPFVATEDEAVVGNFASVARYRVLDGGIAWVDEAPTGDAGVAVAVAYDADAGVVAFADKARWGRAAFGAPAPLAELEPLPAALSGSSGGYLWFTDVAPTVIAVPASPLLPTARRLINGSPPTFSTPTIAASGRRPVVKFGPGEALGAVPSVVNGEVELTLYRNIIGADLSSASERWLHAAGVESHYFWPLK